MEQGQQDSPKVQLIITADVGRVLSADEGFRVDGPIKNKALCYMMLELAKDFIRNFADEEAKKVIVDPSKATGTHSAGG